jgi:hypothetical protein
MPPWKTSSFDRIKKPLNKSSGKYALSFGMGCKAQTAVVAVAIASISNAAERPNRQMQTA